MSKLVAVKRMDKTGKMVTRHVRADKAQADSSSIPPVAPPAAAPAVTDPGLAKRLKRLDARLPMTFRREQLPIRANPRLEPWFRDTYGMTTTSNELYALMGKVTVDDAIVMAAAGLNSKNIDTFIRKQKWEVVDNTGIVSELRARGVDARDYIEAVFDEDAAQAPTAAIVDAAEVKTLYNGSASGERFGPRKIYASYLFKEQINFSDIKEIGVTRCFDTEHFGRLLLRLKSGKSVCSAREIREMLERTEKVEPTRQLRDYERNMVVGSRVLLAAKLGTEIAEKAINTPVVMHAADLAADARCTNEQVLEFCEFINGMITNEYASHVDQYTEVSQWLLLWREPHEAGISNDRIVEGKQHGMSAMQIIAAEKEGVPLSITGGWL